MPKPGFMSITVKEEVWKYFHDRYIKLQHTLTLQGIMTFSAYIMVRMSQSLRRDQIKFRFALASIKDNFIVISDSWTDEIAEIRIHEREGLWCEKCQKEFCIHTGFCMSLYQVYPRIARQIG